MMLRILVGFALSLSMAAAQSGAPGIAVPKPAAMEMCPVCGMLVSKYPNWASAVVWKDGQVRHFDGAKDLFKYLLDLPKYAAGRKREEIAAIAVTDFYDLKKVDARKAFYVIGSDVIGPMGHELVPLATREDAEGFLKDHKGKRIVSYSQVTAEMVAQVDRGAF